MQGLTLVVVRTGSEEGSSCYLFIFLSAQTHLDAFVLSSTPNSTINKTI